MSTSRNPQPEKTYFEQQRELVLQDVATNLEQVLQNMNTLNRSLESVIAVCVPRFPLLGYPNARPQPARRPYAARVDLQLRKEQRVGNEFGQVEGLWSMFENVMAQQQQSNNTQEEEGQTQGGGQEKGDRQ
ncbi:hypothetical protein D6D04_08978 [Aureobasidium pullulans]|nr:hypothetical protein D6D04_08978 [Aureobasidium pullulans]